MEIQKGCAYLGIIEPHEYDDVKKTHVYKQVLTKAEFEIPRVKARDRRFFVGSDANYKKKVQANLRATW